MNKTTIVAFLLLISNFLSANTLIPEINDIESQWAIIYYGKSNTAQKAEYPLLLVKTQNLLKEHPDTVELIIWQAIILSTNAAYDSPFTALDSLNSAKELLELAIQKNPNALEGAAFVALGTLYYMTPSWPISFGDQDKAKHLLLKALEINPNSIDANYFYADYLLSHDKITEATKYLQQALKIPSRTAQLYADNQLKKEVTLALKKTHQRKLDSGKNKFLSLFFDIKSNE